MKILLTGASGLVGSAFARLASASGHEVFGVVGRWSEIVFGVTGLLARDLSDPAQAQALVQGIHPACIINAAAISEPAACEADPARSQQVNVDFPVALAVVAAQARVRLIHLSSEQVFDGESAPYRPGDAVRPLNLYGRQKAEAEARVLAADKHAAVVRLPLLFGNSLTGRRSVHEKFFELWAAGKTAGLFVDERRQVCSAASVAAMLLALAARRDLHGIFHWAGAESVSRHEMGQAICRQFGVDEKWIRAQRRAELPEFAAKRPRDLSLDCAPLDRELGLPREKFAEAITQLVRPAWARELEL
ncbi:MAG: NAD(P)-dependent oxidoreductase [Opitutus sp.]|nr:NAD(P)-dependent oxidoreductase [Opitutus sp.]